MTDIYLTAEHPLPKAVRSPNKLDPFRYPRDVQHALCELSEAADMLGEDPPPMVLMEVCGSPGEVQESLNELAEIINDIDYATITRRSREDLSWSIRYSLGDVAHFGPSNEIISVLSVLGGVSGIAAALKVYFDRHRHKKLTFHENGNLREVSGYTVAQIQSLIAATADENERARRAPPSPTAEDEQFMREVERRRSDTQDSQ